MNSPAKIITLILIALLFHVGPCEAKADSNSCTHQMLLFLQKEQSKGESHFPKGLFPSYRQYAYRPNVLKDDDNLFFTALTLMVLNEIYPKLPDEDQKIVQQIRTRALPAFALFANQKGQLTYNFWQTNPPKVFPNSGWLNWFDKPQALPDDFDDTAIGLLAEEADTAKVEKIHEYMQGFTNHPRKPIRNTLRKYRHIDAYSVWFGKKFPVDFDICVLSNVLTLVSTYQLDWTSADSASLYLIEKVIADKEYLKHPAFISPHYHSTSIILYHFSRLMAANPKVLIPYKEALIQATKKEWQTAENPVEKAMLSTTLKRFGVKNLRQPTEMDCRTSIDQYAFSDFIFFIANMASMLPNPLKSPVSKWGIGHFNYYCPAYNVALLLENEWTN